MSFGIWLTLGRDKWGMTIEPTPTKAIEVPSAIITWIEDGGHTKEKDEKSKDIWCEPPKSKTHTKDDIPKELWGNWPTKEETDIACGYKEINFWNCSTRVLGLVKVTDEAIVTVLYYRGL